MPDYLAHSVTNIIYALCDTSFFDVHTAIQAKITENNKIFFFSY